MAFTMYSFAIGFALPLILIAAFYLRVVQRLRRAANMPVNNSTQSSRRARTREHTNRRIENLVIGIICTYTICWLPYWIIQISVSLTKNQSPGFYLFVMVGTSLSYTNSALNPLLYAFLSDNFKRRFALFFVRQTNDWTNNNGSRGISISQNRLVLINCQKRTTTTTTNSTAPPAATTTTTTTNGKTSHQISPNEKSSFIEINESSSSINCNKNLLINSHNNNKLSSQTISLNSIDGATTVSDLKCVSTKMSQVEDKEKQINIRSEIYDINRSNLREKANNNNNNYTNEDIISSKFSLISPKEGSFKQLHSRFDGQQAGIRVVV